MLPLTRCSSAANTAEKGQRNPQLHPRRLLPPSGPGPSPPPQPIVRTRLLAPPSQERAGFIEEFFAEDQGVLAALRDKFADLLAELNHELHPLRFGRPPLLLVFFALLHTPCELVSGKKRLLGELCLRSQVRLVYPDATC